jgi:hypothetical protein
MCFAGPLTWNTRDDSLPLWIFPTFNQGRNMKLARIIRQTHQGVGLLIGIQVLLWISGGFVMSAFPLAKVRGEDWAAEKEIQSLNFEDEILSPLTVAQSVGWSSLDRAELVIWQGQPVFRLSHGMETVLAKAGTGVLLSPLTEKWARVIAEADYTGPGAVVSVTRQTEPESEIRGRDLPLWRVAFDDSRSTTIYVSPQSGNVVARRNNIWRVYDFFWMLHIMDYSSRDDFNHPLLIGSAVVAWLLATSGIWLVVTWLKRRRSPAR